MSPYHWNLDAEMRHGAVHVNAADVNVGDEVIRITGENCTSVGVTMTEWADW